MEHDHNHENIALKPEYRDIELTAKANAFMRDLTSARGQVLRSVASIDEILASSRGEEVLNSFNISKERLLAAIQAYKTMLANAEDFC